MSKKSEKETADQQSAEQVKIERVAIFSKDFKIVKSYGHASSVVSVINYRARQPIFDDATIDALLLENAPLKVYSRNVD